MLIVLSLGPLDGRIGFKYLHVLTNLKNLSRLEFFVIQR